MTQVSIKQTRDELAELLDRVAFGGEEFVLTRFGKPRAMLVPYKITGGDAKYSLDSVFGAWKSRKDIQDSVVWSRKLRKNLSQRKNVK